MNNVILHIRNWLIFLKKKHNLLTNVSKTLITKFLKKQNTQHQYYFIVIKKKCTIKSLINMKHISKRR